LDIGVLGYIGIVWPKEHSPEVRSFPPGTPCIYKNIITMHEPINVKFVINILYPLIKHNINY
jgi:hypothetical protein